MLQCNSPDKITKLFQTDSLILETMLSQDSVMFFVVVEKQGLRQDSEAATNSSSHESYWNLA